jgi:hypothetical protein
MTREFLIAQTFNGLSYGALLFLLASELARHVTVLHYGKVLADGSREEVRRDPLVREIYLGA